MRVHHLNCATLCTAARPLLRGPSGSRGLVCHCLLVETEAGLVLVDAGLGTADLRDPAGLGRGFRWLIRPALDPAETALAQVRRLGFRAEDVRHVVLTHLDLDHAGGIADFPWATVHVMDEEVEAAERRAHPMEKERYRPRQWAHRPRFQRYRARGQDWFGFERVDALVGLPPEILLIPLFGHTRGHAGVAVLAEGRWMLHAGDAYFHHRDIRGPRGPLLLEAFARLDDIDVVARRRNRERLRALSRRGDVDVFCAHDPVELGRFAPA